MNELGSNKLHFSSDTKFILNTLNNTAFYVVSNTPSVTVCARTAGDVTASLLLR